jgi:hypothetical protein
MTPSLEAEAGGALPITKATDGQDARRLGQESSVLKSQENSIRTPHTHAHTTESRQIARSCTLIAFVHCCGGGRAPSSQIRLESAMHRGQSDGTRTAKGADVRWEGAACMRCCGAVRRADNRSWCGGKKRGGGGGGGGGADV